MMVPIKDKTNLFDINTLKYNKNEWFNTKLPTKATVEFLAPVSLAKAKNATFQAAMKVTILIGQWFGINPVLGVCEADTSKMRFKFFSARCLYGILSAIGQMMLVVYCLMKLFRDDNSKLAASSSLIFYGTNAFTGILFLRVAMQWPKLCQHIARTESIDPNTDYGLVRRCHLSCISILMLALVEHVLSVISGISISMDCQPDTMLYDAFLLTCFPWVWTFVPYNRAYGAVLQFLNFQSTFNWNFADAFVVSVSLCLISRLNQINKRIKDVKGKDVPSYFWRIMREDYTRVTNLVKKVDDVISGIVFISFANNLFFICMQLLHTLEEGFKVATLCSGDSNFRPMRGYEQAVYHLYSFLFLLGRSLAVSLIAAKVHSASKEPAQALYEVPSSGFCMEVQRFLNQVHCDTVALSGLQFFNVKRGLVLSIAGTVVTYELVLMQFTGVTPTSSPPIGGSSTTFNPLEA